jgi:cytochrome c-type biogenesis protein CcmH
MNRFDTPRPGVFAWAILAAFVTVLVAAPATARVEAVKFETAEQEALYNGLIKELRCLVCANQSLSDSNADLAQDLRGKVYQMVSSGQSRDQIIDYMVERYSEYVLYRPRLSAATIFLWFGPFLAVLAGLIFIMLLVRKKSRQRPQIYTAEQLQKAASLLEDDNQS